MLEFPHSGRLECRGTVTLTSSFHSIKEVGIKHSNLRYEVELTINSSIKNFRTHYTIRYSRNTFRFARLSNAAPCQDGFGKPYTSQLFWLAP